MHRLVHPIPLCHRLRDYFLACLIMLSLTASMFSVTTAYAATGSHDSLVTIAVDDTPASCVTIKTVRDLKTHKLLAMTRAKCAAGTEMTTRNVPLAQAKARREAYVMVPSERASSNDWRQWYAQAQQLLNAKTKLLQQPAHTQSASCSGAGYVNITSATWQVILNDYVAASVVYYLSQDCSSVYLQEASLSTGYVPYNNPVWWIGFTYDSMPSTVCNSGFPYELFPTSTYTYHPNSTQPSGHIGVFDLDGGDLCFFGQGGVIKYLRAGPLN